MRKIIEEHLEFFREKDLKRYSRKVNSYFKRKFRFVFVVFLVSCSVQDAINKEKFEKMPKSISCLLYTSPSQRDRG